MGRAAVVTTSPEAMDYLSQRDKKLGAAIACIGPITRGATPDLFEAMVGNIIGQQISGKAARTVELRLAELCGGVTPARIGELSAEAIQGCGMSMRKAGYIKGIAEAAAAGVLDGLSSLDDDAVIKHLVELPGIGVWTAEMLLIFSLLRPDVVSFGDLGIRRGMTRLYGLQAEPTAAQFARYRKRYSPHGTAASLYLWHLSAEDG